MHFQRYDRIKKRITNGYGQTTCFWCGYVLGHVQTFDGVETIYVCQLEGSENSRVPIIFFGSVKDMELSGG